MATIVDLKHGVFKIKDAATTPNVVTVKLGEGSLSYSEGRNIEYKLDSGKLDIVREGDDMPVEVSFDFTMVSVATAAVATPDFGTVRDIIDGTLSGAKSTDPDVCAPYACDLEFTWTAPCGGTPRVITLSFPDFRHDKMTFNLKEGTCSVTGKCNVKKAVKS